MEIKKWHVYIADLDPQRGTEPGKVRPVVVVQTDLLNGVHPSTVVCPLTTNVQPRARILRVHLAAGEAGLNVRSDIMADQIRAIDNRRFIERLGKITRASQARLAEKLTRLQILVKTGKFFPFAETSRVPSISSGPHCGPNARLEIS